MPKALLPVANKPIISYTLEWLEKAGIHGNDFPTFNVPIPVICSRSTLPVDAILLIQGSGAAYHKLTTYISRGYQGSVHCNVVSVDEDFGTAEALRSIKDRIEVGRCSISSRQTVDWCNFYYDRKISLLSHVIWLLIWIHASFWMHIVYKIPPCLLSFINPV